MHKNDDADADRPKRDDDKGPSGGNSGAGKSGKEDMGSEKPTTSPELGSRKPGANQP